ncbi:MAG TPA: MoaD/ThiS family protein [Tepidiformaceae bacterium]|nr:MoaD/ThiS family protein [Tepidiformaceae bacterium]
MAKVWIPSPLRPLCGGVNALEVPGTTLRDVLEALDQRCPGFMERVVDEGRVRPELAIAIDGEARTFALFQDLRPDADVTIIPAISGG